MMNKLISKTVLASTLVVISPVCHGSYIEYSVSSLSAIIATDALPYDYEMKSVAMGVDLPDQYNAGLKFERRKEYAGKNNPVSELSTNVSLVKFYRGLGEWNVDFGLSRLEIKLADEPKPTTYHGLFTSVGVGLPVEHSRFVPNLRVRYGRFVNTQRKEQLQDVQYRVGVAFPFESGGIGILINVGLQRLDTGRSLAENDNIREGVFTVVAIRF